MDFISKGCCSTQGFHGSSSHAFPSAATVLTDHVFYPKESISLGPEVSCSVGRVPRTLLPGVRSSRLKDRLKEERELSVKKAFIEDMMKENKLLNTLSERLSVSRAVLWHPNLLPSVAKGSIDRDYESAFTSDVETVNDLCDSDDFSCDFQANSGPLTCVACGILGYPLMSVIQPSEKAATQLFPRNHLKTEGPAEGRQKLKSSRLQNITKSDISASDDNETFDTHGVLRPRFFCLEHAVETEELLRPKGGAKTLVICHSDYQKIKINASTVADEIRTAFNCEEVQLDNPSKEELSLIDIAIDGEQFKNLQEDWTSRLGMNLRHSVNFKTSCPSKKIEDINPEHLRSVFAPDSMISSIKWFSRRSRTRRVTKYVKHSKPYGGNDSNTYAIIDESGTRLKRRERVLIQYSRRKYRTKSRITMDSLQEATNINCGTIEACDPSISPESKLLEEKSNEANYNLLEIEKPLTCGNNNIQVDTNLIEACDRDCGTIEACDPSISPESKLLEEKFNEANYNLLEIENPLSCGNNNIQVDTNLMEEAKDENIKCPNRSVSDIPNSAYIAANDAEIMDSTMELNMPTLPKESCKAKKRMITNVKVTYSRRSKKAREIEQGEAHNDFVKSPCEGLRPRKKQVDPVTSSNKEQEQKPLKKAIAKKPSRSSICQDGKSDCPSYKCNLQQCRMFFKTSAEVSLHKRNKCHFENCEKKFRSHKYVVLHQRVHDDRRPLKCSWKGCRMTFKWAWARTEHTRLHTGERPYKCGIEGCDRTFRFVSDFSRHRRKMGHYVNQG